MAAALFGAPMIAPAVGSADGSDKAPSASTAVPMMEENATGAASAAISPPAAAAAEPEAAPIASANTRPDKRRAHAIMLETSMYD